MAKRIILKETDLSLGSNPPAGYKYLGFDDDTLSERTGATVSGIGSVGYKVYKALLTQTGTGDPVAIVLENTLGVVPSYSRPGFLNGVYELTATGLFSDYTKLFINFLEGASANKNNKFFYEEDTANTIVLRTFLSGTLTDGLMYRATILIELYD
jgi:hypothetical protein